MSAEEARLREEELQRDAAAWARVASRGFKLVLVTGDLAKVRSAFVREWGPDEALL